VALACVPLSRPDGINWLVNASFSAAHASITTSIYVVNDDSAFRLARLAELDLFDASIGLTNLFHSEEVQTC